MLLKLTEDYFGVTIFKLKVTGFSQINNNNLYLITFHMNFSIFVWLYTLELLQCFYAIDLDVESCHICM